MGQVIMDCPECFGRVIYTNIEEVCSTCGLILDIDTIKDDSNSNVFYDKIYNKIIYDHAPLFNNKATRHFINHLSYMHRRIVPVPCPVKTWAEREKVRVLINNLRDCVREIW